MCRWWGGWTEHEDVSYFYHYPLTVLVTQCSKCLIQPNTLIRYVLDDLVDLEEDYSDYHSHVQLGFQESLGGAAASLRPMTSEEAQLQFQSVNAQCDTIEAGQTNIKSELVQTNEDIACIKITQQHAPKCSSLTIHYNFCHPHTRHIPAICHNSQWVVSHVTPVMVA